MDLHKEQSAADKEGSLAPMAGWAGALILVAQSSGDGARLTDILTPDFCCRLATGADGAIATALAHASDLIVLEQPEGSALATELCCRLRADPRLRDVPVLLVTPTLDSENLPSPSLEGANDCLLTPLRPGEVLARVHSLVQLRRARLEAERLMGVCAAASRLPHEVNNPLAFVSGGLEQLCESLRGLANNPSARCAPELLAELDQIEREVRSGVQRIRAVVQHLSLLADSGQGPLI